VAMLARKVHQNRSMRTSQPKSARQQITTTQSLKERPSIIMSDESYEEPVQQYKTSTKPRSSSGNPHARTSSDATGACSELVPRTIHRT
jgi:hypothetical protein